MAYIVRWGVNENRIITRSAIFSFEIHTNINLQYNTFSYQKISPHVAEFVKLSHTTIQLGITWFFVWQTFTEWVSSNANLLQ